MINKIKKILCFVIPLVLVVAIALAFVPKTFGLKEEKTNTNFSASNDYSDQVVYAAESTGASTAAKSYKGGAIFLEPNTTYIMNGGTISGHQNTYGGAVYVSSGATFTMNGGTISHNRAEYGGAVYVEAGGHFILNGGTIERNYATAASGVYVEEGGDFQFLEGKIDNNTYPGYITYTRQVGVSLDELIESLKSSSPQYSSVQIASSSYNGLELNTLKFGSYPQSYVGDELNEELTSWLNSSTPEKEIEYKVTSQTWTGYKYIDGNIYVNGVNNPFDDVSFFENGAEKESGESLWFKVEPINWIVLNYEKWVAGDENAELLSEKVLVSDIPWDEVEGDKVEWADCSLRTWLNEEFYNTAFTTAEAQKIVKKELINNGADWSSAGTTTNDNVWLLSYFEIYSDFDDQVDFDVSKKYSMFYNDVTLSIAGQSIPFPLDNGLFLSNNDFAISNCIKHDIQEGAQIVKIPSQIWTRSVSLMGAFYFPCVTNRFHNEGESQYFDCCGVCPCIEADLVPQRSAG